ncbi:sodium-dependent transporter [Saccharomonospora xinjiangensis]|uniref:sodium-dependent transporter n=1 Tax=Saccharomonospora xinjiangensis TaxID=75294 RepID=UPI00106FBC08|nr:sodium-dependent transporter [Saccharomonospora xinjiangensis]QBQ59989.1 Sodium:neurotransmitter symporter family protein [Saccharomonospora xinjiangensis]
MHAEHREQWGTRAGFLMAAIGSAIGLGNIWRFPYIAYENGGGAFLVPYLAALLTAGIPLLIMEYSLGHKYRATPPTAFLRLSKPAQVIGWWQVLICFVIAAYYAVIIAWSVMYTGFSFTKAWGDDPETFLFSDVLKAADAPTMDTSFVGTILLPLIAVWLITLGVLAAGVRKGIERANKIFIPLLLVMFVALVIRAITLPGAADGLNAFFQPDWSAITDGSVWVAAYGQIFFSLSIGFGIMITYSSYLRRRSDLSGSAMVAGFANSSFELLAGIGVFATIGFMAANAGIPVSELATSGIGLAFVAFPQIISNMPAGELFGVLFFASLTIAGLTSMISIVQVIVGSVADRTGLRRIPAVLIVGGFTALVSILLFPTTGGLYLLDVVDHFINQYGIVVAALVSVIVVAWVLRQLKPLEQHANATSAIRLGLLWRITLGVITPLVLGWMMWDSLQTELSENYGDYEGSFLLGAGWGVALGALVLGVILSIVPWKRGGKTVEEEVQG